MIKSSLVLAAALCLTRLLRRRAASERHAVWAAAIISAAALPLFTWLMPSWNSSLIQRMAASLPRFQQHVPARIRPTALM
jgi:hypothetical protein